MYPIVLYRRIAIMDVGNGGQEGRAPTWIFIHDTDIAHRGLIVLFSVFFRCSPPLEIFMPTHLIAMFIAFCSVILFKYESYTDSVFEKTFGDTKFENCWKWCVHFLEAFRLTLIGRNRQYERKRISVWYLYWRFLPMSVSRKASRKWTPCFQKF